MAHPSSRDPIEPMDLANMRQNGVRSLAVQCHKCRHQVIINADHWPGDLTVKSFEPRMVCTKCGTIGADVRPNWPERKRYELTPPAACSVPGPRAAAGRLLGPPACSSSPPNRPSPSSRQSAQCQPRSWRATSARGCWQRFGYLDDFLRCTPSAQIGVRFEPSKHPSAGRLHL
jgi:hypothetical protein